MGENRRTREKGVGLQVTEHVGAHHQLNLSGKTRALGEINEMLQAEGQSDCLIHIDPHPSLALEMSEWIKFGIGPSAKANADLRGSVRRWGRLNSGIPRVCKTVRSVGDQRYDSCDIIWVILDLQVHMRRTGPQRAQGSISRQTSCISPNLWRSSSNT